MTRFLTVLLVASCAILIGCSSDDPEPPPIVAQPVVEEQPEPEQVQVIEQQQEQEQPLPAFALQTPVSAILLDYSLHESLVHLVGGGWRCLFHEDPDQWIVFQQVSGDDSWSVDLNAPWQAISGGEYQMLLPGPASGTIGACLRVGNDVDDLWAELRKQRAEEAKTRAALRELELLKQPKPVDWQEMTINPTPPAVYCEDNPHELLVGYQADVDAHMLRIAIRPRNDGVIWVAVEDDADWPNGCHVYSVEWERNSDTGWYHSEPIAIYGR